MKTLLLILSTIFLSSNVFAQSVGINTDGSSPDTEAQLHIKTDNLKYGLLNELTATGPALSYGVYNDMLGDASVAYYGIFNKLPSTSPSVLYGTYNSLISDVSLERYGTYNRISGAGDARKYGTYNDLSASSGFQYATFTTIKTDGNDFAQLGNFQSISGSGNGDHYGTSNKLIGSGTGRHIGVNNEMGGNGNSAISAISTTITNSGPGIHYGVENVLQGGGGDHYGVHNTIAGLSNGDRYGMYTLISNTGSGLHYGTLTELTGTSSGLQVGNRNEISNIGNGDHWGTYNGVSGNGSGGHKGSYNLLLGSGTGSQIGSDQQITISGNGIHAGTTNSVNGIGSGIHYGSKNSLSGIGSGDQYGTHNVVTNTGSGAHYAGWFDAPGSSNNYAAVFNRGNVVANEIGGNFDFRIESANENGMLFVDGTNDRVGIGTDVPASTFHISDDDASGRIALIENVNTGINADALLIKLNTTDPPETTNAFIAFRNGSDVLGSITGDASGGINFTTSSDRRLKMDIQDFDGGLSLVNKIQARIYERISNPGHKEIGFIAQELYEVHPQIVSGTPDQPIEDPMTVDYGKLTPVLVAAIQELSKENDKLKEQLAMQAETLQVVVQKLDELGIK